MNPFSKDKSQALSSLGETKLIEKLRVWLGDASPPAPFGVGDDCAVLPPATAGAQTLVTADPVIYGQHFDQTLLPAQAAAKLVRRNVSDIAAMGGHPTHAVVSLALDPNVSISWLEAFYKALAAEAQSFQISVVGGDVSNAPNFLGAFLTLYGETAPHTAPLLRHAAQTGSPLLVTGALGGTRLSKHHSFTPRLKEALWLARSGLCLSCSDLSDGLGKDLANLLPHGLAGEVDCAKLPVSADAVSTATGSGKDELYHVFNDGEDYELLFALQPDTDLSAFFSNWRASLDTPVTLIGYAVDSDGSMPGPLILKNAPAPFVATGYEHLR